MATAERKARKRAGEKFIRKEKTPTPPAERSYVTRPVPGPGGTHLEGTPVMRSEKSVQKFLNRFTQPTEDVNAGS